MVNFQVKLDERFDELINDLRFERNNVSLDEIISLKSYIIDIYMMDCNYENLLIKNDLKKIDLRI
jgi:hypothetical protein